MGQQEMRDRLRRDPGGAQYGAQIDQRRIDGEAGPLRLVERSPHPGVDQQPAGRGLDQKRAQDQRDAVLLVRGCELVPDRLRHLTEHAPAVQAKATQDEPAHLPAAQITPFVHTCLPSSAILRDRD